jgi:DNA-binding transcriptional ArsR family regulator
MSLLENAVESKAPFGLRSAVLRGLRTTNCWIRANIFWFPFDGVTCDGLFSIRCTLIAHAAAFSASHLQNFVVILLWIVEPCSLRELVCALEGTPVKRKNKNGEISCSSYGDMIKTVLSCKHPKLKPHQRPVLNALASFASPTGRGARPTYQFLQNLGDDGTSRQHVGRILKQLYGLGLVERMHQGQGKGNASIWRICLESPYFPDTYATRKADDESMEPAEQLREPVEAVNATSSASLGNLETELTQPPQVAPPKSPSKSPSNHPTKEMPSGWMDGAKLAAMGMPTANERKRLETLAASYLDPWPLLQMFIGDWQDTRPRGMTGLGQPWMWFFKECGGPRLRKFVEASYSLCMKHVPGFVEQHEKHIDKVAIEINKAWSSLTREQLEEKAERDRYAALTTEEREREDAAVAEELFGPVAAKGSNEESV